ncbi:MAG: DUF2878 domain-containing protein [Myxococcota bacterium]
MKRIFIYQLCFEAVWCACIFGAAWGLPWLGPVTAALWITFRLRTAERPGRDLALVVFAGIFGLVADGLLMQLGGVHYTGLAQNALIGPTWILALWMAFAMSINVSFTWLRGRPGLAAALGLAGGMLSYACGRRLGAVDFLFSDLHTLAALSLVWGCGLPLLVYVAERCEKGDWGIDQAFVARASLASFGSFVASWMGGSPRP